MPNSLIYRPTLIDTLTSIQRIHSYQSVFLPTNDVELMGVYLWNSHVVGSLYPLVSTLEVALRNAINETLTNGLGRFWWDAPAPSASPILTYVSQASPTLPQAVSDLRGNFARATNKFIREESDRTGIPRRHISLDHGGIVAKTDFSTWEHLLDSEFLGRSHIWPRYLGKVFGGPWPFPSSRLTLTFARNTVHEIREFRNRLFHHEPAWKKFGTVDEADALNHLKDKIARIKELLNLIHPEVLRMLEVNGLLASADRAATSNEIRRFQHTAKTMKVKSITSLAALLSHCGSSNSAIQFKTYRKNNGHRTFVVIPKR